MIQPLDLKTIFVNYLSGSTIIFLFLFIIFLAYLAARLRMPNRILLALSGLFIVMFASLGFQSYYPIVIFITGLFFYFVLSKIIKT